MSNPADNQMPGARQPPTSDGGSLAVKIVAIIAVVLVSLFMVCAGCFYLVFRSVAESWDRSVRSVVERADREAVRSREWHEKTMEQARTEGLKSNADRGDAKRFAEDFLTALRERRFADAHRETTAAFRERFPSAEDLESFVQAHPALSRPTLLIDADLGQQGGTRQRFSATAAEGEMLEMKVVQIAVCVIREGLNWKADELTLSAELFPTLPSESRLER